MPRLPDHSVHTEIQNMNWPHVQIAGESNMAHPNMGSG